MENQILNRNKFAFSNGNYYNRVIDPNDGNSVSTAFISRESDIDETNPAKTFNVPFESFDNIIDWHDIVTPAFDQIIQNQFSNQQEVQDFFYASIGRMLFDKGDLDNWQYGVHLCGIGGSGKSLILHLVKSFYQTQCVFDLDFNNPAQQNSFIAVSQEIPLNANLNSINSVSSHWIGCSNELPPKGQEEEDNCVVFPFLKAIPNCDNRLRYHMDNEMPAILQKVTRAYHDLVNLYHRNTLLWDIAPESLKVVPESLKVAPESLKVAQPLSLWQTLISLW